MGDGRARAVVEGELDLATAHRFEQVVRDRLAADVAVVVDCSRVTFIDSNGVRSLHSLVRASSTNGWRLTISDDLPPVVEQVLELTSMMALLPFEGRRR
jgi:anti-anti-sigma factor